MIHGLHVSMNRWMDKVVGMTVTQRGQSTTSSLKSSENLDRSLSSEASQVLQALDEWELEMTEGRGLDFGVAMDHIDRLRSVAESVLQGES